MLPCFFSYPLIPVLLVLLRVATATFQGIPDLKDTTMYNLLRDVGHGDFDIFVDTISVHCKEFISALGIRHQIALILIPNLGRNGTDPYCKRNYKDFQPQTTLVIVSLLESLGSALNTMKSVSDKAKESSASFSLKIIIKWPFVLESERNIDFQKLIDISTTIDIDTQLYIVFIVNASKVTQSPKTEDYSTTTIFEVYSIKNKSFVQKVFLRNSYTLINLFSQSTFRRQDFRGVPISAISPIEAGLENIIEIQRTNNSILLVGGYSTDIYRVVRDAMNFTESVVEGIGWVSLLPNGSIGGMAQQVIRDEADISIPLQYLTPYRMEKLTFLQPISSNKLVAIFRKPDSRAYRDIYNDPFNDNVWIAILSTQLFVLVSIIGILFVQSAFRRICQLETADDNWLAMDSIIFATVGFISQQGWYITPAATYFRIIFISGLFLGMMIYTFYCAMLISGLSFDISLIKTLTDLVTFKYTILIDRNIFQKDYLEQLFQHKSQEAMALLRDYDNETTAVQRVLSGGYAYFKPKDTFFENTKALNYSDSFICNSVGFVQVTDVEAKSGMFIRKNSPFKKIFNYRIITISEKGVKNRFLEHMKQKTHIMCSKNSWPANESKGLGLQEVITAFVLLAFGNLFCILNITIEIFVSHLLAANI